MRQSDINLNKIIRFDDSTIIEGQRCLAYGYNSSKSGYKINSLLKRLLRSLYMRFYRHKKCLFDYIIPETPKCVVVAAGGNLGGAIISLPLIVAARDRWPSSHLVVIGNTKHSLEIVKYAQVGDDHILVPNVSFKGSFFNSEVKTFQKMLTKYSPDIFISNHNFQLDFLLIPLSIPCRIGSVNSNIYGDRLEWDNFYNIPVRCDSGINWLDSYSDIASKFSGKHLEPPDIAVSENDKNFARKFLSSLGFGHDAKFVAVQAGVWEQHSFKQWPVQLLVETCKILFNDYGIIPVVFGVKGQEYTVKELQRVMSKSNVVNLVAKTSPADAAAMISICSVSIVNDSGLMHLSAAVGVPTVFLCGVTDLTWVYGDRKNCRIIRHSGCKPCYAINRFLVDSCAKPCLSSIQPKTVVSAVTEILFQ